ncbi:MAG TPA: LppX_LprAFG lipoprotein [Micromonosporaceae bacterium]
MRRALAALCALALVLAVGAACSGHPPKPAKNLPDGAGLVSSAAREMGGVKTARFVITTEGTVDRLGLTGADAVVTRDGDAKGTATLDQAGAASELTFVVVGDTLHIKGPTGGWQQVPLSMAASVYDPSAILDPDRGVAKVLATASDASTQGTETVDGAAAIKVRATLDSKALAAVVPGIDQNVVGTLWIGADRPLLHRASFTVPGDGGGGTVTVTLSEFDAPVTISAP